jgi:hypothetical protein
MKKRKLRSPGIHKNHVGYEIKVKNNTVTTPEGTSYDYVIEFYEVVKNKIVFIPYETTILFDTINYCPKKVIDVAKFNVRKEKLSDVKKIVKELKVKFIKES